MLFGWLLGFSGHSSCSYMIARIFLVVARVVTLALLCVFLGGGGGALCSCSVIT